MEEVVGDLALCMPLTSRGSTGDIHKEWAKCARMGPRVRLYIGVDEDDTRLSNQTVQFFASAFGLDPTEVTVRLFAPNTPLLDICSELMGTALQDARNRFFSVWGDDMTLVSHSSVSELVPLIAEGFAAYPQPVGFRDVGCVALNDEASPGFPTFPVIGRGHFAIFSRYCPREFVNQDADPWIFEVYRRFGWASFAECARVRNTIGGTDGTPRYEKKHVRGWKDSLLENSVAQVAAKCGVCPTVETLDVVVPTFRCELPVLARIAALRQPDGFSTMIHVVCDDPGVPSAVRRAMKKLESVHFPRLRVRFNESNQGASGARNRGLDESSARWVLFLDDDVEVHDDLLLEYAAAIQSHPASAGFVGVTTFPPPANSIQRGVELSYLTYFWDCALRTDHPPWGVTANLLLRRTTARFHMDFVKTGGGEDIAMCLDTVRLVQQPLRSAGSAAVVHPWWNGGKVSPMRFFRWTQGDGLLVDKYPQHTYRAFPNAHEMALALAAAAALSSVIPLPFEPWSCLAWLVWLACVEVCDDGCAAVLSGRLRGFEVVACLQCTRVKAYVEFGHAWVHLKRLRMGNLTKRFDWHCGTLAGNVARCQILSAVKFALLLSCPAWVDAWVVAAFCVACVVARWALRLY